MPACFRNFTVVEDVNLIRITDCGKPMCNNDNRTALRQLRECLLHQYFILRIGKGCGFIKDDNRSFLQNRSRNGDALLLSAGKVGAFRTENGVDAMWESLYDIVTLCGMKRLGKLRITATPL